MESTQIGPEVANTEEKGFWKWLQSYPGLITFTIVYEFLLIIFLTTFSEPVVQIFGAPLIPIQLEETHRVARIIMVYHSLAITFLGALVFYILDLMDVRPKYENLVKWSILPGFILTSLSGLTFAYILVENWIVHALFLVGLTLVFFSGILLVIGVWPTRSFPGHSEGPYIGSVHLGQLSLVIVGICLLGSAMLGAAVGAYFGNGFEAALMEDLLRVEHNIFERGIIGHLHIMLTLIDFIILLLVFRYTNPQQTGKIYFISMIFAILGTIITTAGSWLVPIGYEKAHTVINVGATFALMAAIILAIEGWRKISRDVLGDEYDSASIGRKIISIFKNSSLFGLYFLFIWVIITMAIPGIYLAINLEDFRAGPWDIERTIAVGHWHVLATLSAIMILLLTIDYLGIKGVIKEVIGWILTIGSILAFGFAVPYMFTTLGADTSFYFLMIDVGIMFFVAGIAVLCLYMALEILVRKNYTVR